MPVLNRRGFTLAELLVAMVLLAIIGLAVYRVLVGNQRTYQAQTQRMGMQQNLRAVGSVFDGEFRELNAADGDIIAMSSSAITIRAMRKLGFICSAPVLGGALGAVTMIVRAAPYYGVQPFATNDSLLIYYEGDELSRTDDGWHLAKITNVQAQNCPDVPPTPGNKLTMSLAAFVGAQVNKNGAITAGSPVRGFEDVQYLAYQQPSDLKWYLGLQDANGTQPIIGPLTGSTGLLFIYYAATGFTTVVPSQVARIGVRVRLQTAQVVRTGNTLGTPADSVTVQVTLRNNPRF